jgi:hypothetical protein
MASWKFQNEIESAGSTYLAGKCTARATLEDRTKSNKCRDPVFGRSSGRPMDSLRVLQSTCGSPPWRSILATPIDRGVRRGLVRLVRQGCMCKFAALGREAAGIF